jgi:hypothetical protein
VFLLYAVAAGIVVGLLLGGRLERLDGLRLRWVPLALAGLVVQLVLFLRPVGDAVGSLGPPIYVASTMAVLAFVARNVRVAGMAVVTLGAASNLAAIVANGGYMPASASALAAAGLDPSTGYSNSVVLPDPALASLTDIFALPAWVPLANVFSVGDLLIGVGVAVAIAVSMRRRPEGASGHTAPGGPATPVRPGTSPD